MFDSGLEKTIVGTAIALWFAHGWYLNQRLQRVHDKLDLIMENFNGLRQYLYEIDPQFDDERQARQAFETNQSAFAGMDEMQLRKQKEEHGMRTLDTSFLP
jgi:hypothetical protein